MPFFNYKNQNIYYEEAGEGAPLILLHGNTASSRMFDLITPLYTDFRLIRLDFLGHGQSDRLAAFPADLWFSEAEQVIELIQFRGYKNVNLIGTSGGALVALNVALERGEFIHKIIADSFEGAHSLDAVTDFLAADRENTKADENGRQFWQYCHGGDWEKIVDDDTAAATKHNAEIKRFFHKDLSQLTVPALLTASRGDEFAQIARFDFEEVYGALAVKIKDCRIRLFETGGHPAMLSNAEAFADLARAYFNEN